MTKLSSIITTVRHGKKDQAGALEPQGQKQAAHTALNIKHLEGNVILFHSGELRVKDTIRIIGSNVHKNNIEELENYLDDKYDLQDYSVPTLHFLKNKNIRSEYFSQWGEETNDSLLTDFLNQGSDFIDTSEAYSSLEMAKNLAHVIHTQMQFSLLTDASTRTNFINGSHEPVIMSFLYYALNDFKPTVPPHQFLSQLEGSIAYAEGFEILIYQKEHGFSHATLCFRDNKIVMTPEILQEFLSVS